ncbi:MAG: hypothetical protein KJZ59_11360, partial [Pararhodobacter sp.]|nr:hypothetical protein [Pararhodobacter sp.]
MIRLTSLAAATWLAMPAVAQDGAPTTAQIIAALVAGAGQVQSFGPADTALPEGAAIGFVTALIHELGVVAPDSADRYWLSAACEP